LSSPEFHDLYNEPRLHPHALNIVLVTLTLVLSERCGERLGDRGIVARQHYQVGQRIFQLANLRKRGFELLGVTDTRDLVVAQRFELVR
jgi:hypothetical protein